LKVKLFIFKVVWLSNLLTEHLMMVSPETYLMMVGTETYLMMVSPETYLMMVNPETSNLLTERT
jgi:hypothetical protein